MKPSQHILNSTPDESTGSAAGGSTATSIQHGETRGFRQRIVKTTDYDAQRYSKRHQERAIKYRAEARVVAKAMQHVRPGARVLDAPCGAGRLSLDLARSGYQMTAADLGEVMVDTTRKLMSAAGLECQCDVADVENLPYADQQFDASICFRLFHHYPDAQARASLVDELCRVSSRHVLISYNTSRSYSALRNRARHILTGKQVKKYATSLAEVRGYFAKNNFSLVADYARLPLWDSLHLAVFERQIAG